MQDFKEIRNSWFIDQVKKLENSGVSQADIAAKMEVKPQYLNAIVKRRRNVSEKFLNKFCESFGVNQNGLYDLAKIEEKLVNSPLILNEDVKPAYKCSGCQERDHIIEALRETIEAKEGEIEALKTAVNDKERLIEFLTSQDGSINKQTG